LHSKLTINSLAALSLILIVLSALTLFFAAAKALNTENSTAFLFSLVQNANATVTEAYNRLEAQDIAPPQESLTAYNQALLYADEAANQLQAGNISESNSKAIQALQQFKEVLCIVYEAYPEQPTATERTIALQSAIDRASAQLQRLENLTRLVASTGYNTTRLEDTIGTAKALLIHASRNLNQQNFEAASNSLEEAKILVANLLNHVNTFAATLKIQRLTAYVAQTEARLTALRTEATAAQNTDSLAALNSADDSLANAKEYLEKQQINETLTALASSKASEEKAAAYLNPATSTSDTPSVTKSPSTSDSPTTDSLTPSASPASTTPTNSRSPTSTPNTAATTR
jgi:hypothetical protein